MAFLKGIRLSDASDLKKLVQEIGFLPLFRIEGAEGFSVEALTPDQWWTGLRDDPWGWREILSEDEELLYGKFFANRAGFISREWLPLFANWRRDGYDFDSLEEEGLVNARLSGVMRVVSREGRLLSSAMKKEVGAKGFDGAVTSLQMRLYLHISGFGQKVDRFGKPYGWSIGYLSAPESRFGYEYVASAYGEAPEASLQKILKRAHEAFEPEDAEAFDAVFARR